MKHLLLLMPVLLLVSATDGAAQSIRGRVVAADGDPVAAAVVNLVTADGRTVRSSMTAGDGTFSIVAAYAGSYTLQIERIGFAPFTTDVIHLGDGDVVVRSITVTASPVRLEAVRAQTAARCVVRPQDGSQLARLFEAARSALTVIAHVEGSRTLHVRGVAYVRDLDVAGRRQLAVHERYDFEGRGVPFDAVPLRQLVEIGFAVRDGTATRYFGPSAQTLLAEPFLASHCFRRIVTSRGEPQLVGLGFEPVENIRTVGIAGTIWLDRASAAVRRIEYTYRGQTRVAGQTPHGRVDFIALPDGRPFIARWWIRAPILVRDEGAPESSVRQVGTHETGGLVLAVNDAAIGFGDDLMADLEEFATARESAASDSAARAAAIPLDTLDVTVASTAEREAAMAGTRSLMLTAGQIDDLRTRGALVDEALRVVGGLRVRNGRFYTSEHPPDEILCVELTRPSARMQPPPPPPGGLPTREQVPFCEMVTVYLDGVRIGSPGLYLRATGLQEFERIQVLNAPEAYGRFGAAAAAGAILLTTKR